MRARVVSLMALGLGTSAFFWSGGAAAQQTDTNPPVPNVLLLIDNSGSMERMIDGTIPEANSANACNCTDNGPNHAPTCVFPDATNGAAVSPVPNRWNTVQQALAGSLSAQTGARSGFNCVTMPRTPASTFTTEYQIGGVAPYDQNYYLNFHRMVAEDTSTSPGTACVIGPGPLKGASSASNGVGPAPTLMGGGNATDYSLAATVARPYGTNINSAATCNFALLQNGAVTGMSSLMRFGLMTFDTDPDPSTGVSAANSIVTPGVSSSGAATSAFTGMWSYFPNWSLGNGTSCDFSPYAPTSGCQGNPVACNTLTSIAVGARNPGAPPWEGRMVPLPTPSGLTQAQSNAEVQQVILASRPYGATPLAGMFTAAEYYFQGDPSGPQTDPFVKPPSGKPCRQEFIILLTDGAPNLDMRTACAATSPEGGANGTCPFNLPEQTAATLYNNGIPNATQQFVTTFVIGFATSSFDNDGGSLVQCKSLVTSGGLDAACNPPTGSLPGTPPVDPTYAPCCQLEKIAVNGGSTHAYFADTPQDLQNALGSILASIGVTATSRTVPAFSPVLNAGNATMYNAWLYPNPGAPWSGDIKRTTYACVTAGAAAVMQAPNVNNGDDFAANLNDPGTPANRKYVVIEPANAANTVHDATGSIRPFAPATASTIDGLLFETSTQATYPATTATSAAVLTYDALAITAGTNSYPYTPLNGTGTKYLTDTLTKGMILSFIFGQSPSGLPTDFGWVSRCPSCGSGNTLAIVPPSSFGDIYHSTPAVVGPPASLLDDASYSGFRTYITATSGGGDGGSSSPREPVVYAATNDGLLHGFYADYASKTNNEAWAMLLPGPMPQLLSSYPATDKMLLDGSLVTKDVVWDRTTINSTLCASGSTTCPWHTTLVAGYGSTQQGYYAVDVTTPSTPVFRWQLTKMPTGNYQIFGQHSATPAIATISLNDSQTPPVAHEVGVAILPGGVDGRPLRAHPSPRRHGQRFGGPLFLRAE